MSRSFNHQCPPTVAARDLAFAVESARLLDQVNLSAGRGELIGLVGPNGAGKSTLLRVISGLLRPTEGSVILDGSDLSDLSATDVARTLAYVAQLAPSTYTFTGLEVVLMGRYPHLGRFQVEGAADRTIALESMRLTETESFADRPVTSLSGGERQRVFIARALAQQPRVLLLDEPTANLDIQYQLSVLEIVRNLTAAGTTAIVAIHDLNLAARYCDRLVLLAGGRVLSSGSPETVLTPTHIKAAFGVQAAVYRNPLTGALMLNVLDPAGTEQPSEPARHVHVVCGGGTGGEVLYALQRAGFSVTAGALATGDTDRMAAEMLGIEFVPVTAFQPIDDEAHTRHLALVASADYTVFCAMPIGPANRRNVDALSEAQRLICLETGLPESGVHADGAARALLDTLHPLARCRTPAETVAAIEREMRGRSGAEAEPRDLAPAGMQALQR